MKNLGLVGLLGTKFTMELPVYRERLRRAGIEAMVPPRQETRDFIQRTIRDELGTGASLPETKARYLTIIDDLIAEGAEGIVLGCTELPLPLSGSDTSVPVFDTTQIHAAAGVDFALSEDPVPTGPAGP